MHQSADVALEAVSDLAVVEASTPALRAVGAGNLPAAHSVETCIRDALQLPVARSRGDGVDAAGVNDCLLRRR